MNNQANFHHIIKTIAEMSVKSQHILFTHFLSQQKHDTAAFIQRMVAHHYKHLQQIAWSHPEKISAFQAESMQDYLALCAQLQQQTESASSDKRFSDTHWQDNPIFHFIQQAYLSMSQKLQLLVNDITENENVTTAKKLQFFTRQFIDAISPTNFLQSNPEVLRILLETGGESFLHGYQHFLRDLDNGKGLLNIRMTDIDFFEIGKNIAITPGKIIYQNDLIQLIQYQATTEKVYQTPLLIIPPWINKYYILDLQPENSFVKWLLDQGHTVFLISWVNPNKEQADKKFEDYLLEGPLTALKLIKEKLKVKEINTLGYCIGGTLLGCTLAYLAKQNDTTIKSAAFLTSLLDFSEPGDLGVFIDEEQITALENHMQKKGYLEGQIMAAVFNLLRANDLIWMNFVNNYLKGNKAVPFDLLYWNSDSTNIPEKVHSFYLRLMYLHNRLSEADAIILNKIPLNLKEVTIPTYFLAAQADHIVPWRSSYKSMRMLSGKNKFVLTGSGHVAGVVNPPDKNKHGYWINNKKVMNAEQWLETADYFAGSWWIDLHAWLEEYAGSKIPARKILTKQKIEDAPGSYVKMHL